MRARFFRIDDNDIRVDPQAADFIRGGTGVGQYLSMDSTGAYVDLECIQAQKWEQLTSQGTITYEAT